MGKLLSKNSKYFLKNLIFITLPSWKYQLKGRKNMCSTPPWPAGRDVLKELESKPHKVLEIQELCGGSTPTSISLPCSNRFFPIFISFPSQYKGWQWSHETCSPRLTFRSLGVWSLISGLLIMWPSPNPFSSPNYLFLTHNMQVTFTQGPCENCGRQWTWKLLTEMDNSTSIIVWAQRCYAEKSMSCLPSLINPYSLCLSCSWTSAPCTEPLWTFGLWYPFSCQHDMNCGCGLQVAEQWCPES